MLKKILDYTGLQYLWGKINNKLDQRIAKALIAHILDSNNPDMVLGADQGPVITSLISALENRVNVLNTNLINPLLIKTFTYTQAITLAPNYGQEIRIPITVPDGYIFLCVTNVKSNGDIAYSYYTGSSSNVLTCFVGNDRNTQKIIPQGISADVLFMKKWW